MSAVQWKDYSLRGGAADAAILDGDTVGPRVEMKWFSCTVDRKVLKGMIRRSDARALRLFGLWLGALALAGVAAFLTWGTLWCVPLFFVYGTLYSCADHRQHELSHGTPFKTRRLNELFYQLCAFMTLREAAYYRWSHSRHHTDTIIVGRDAEIPFHRPPAISVLFLDLFFLRDGPRQLYQIARNATGTLTENGDEFVPEGQRRRVVWSSRAYLAAIATVVLACFATGSILPAMFVVLPRFYGGPLSQLFNIMQHAGLDEDVYDHRLNTRTVLLNPVLSFLYANMNYHIEHHMFPMVPFYALPELHALIADQCPAPIHGLVAAYREIIPALVRQRVDPTYFILKRLPDGAIVEQVGPVAA